MDTERIVKLGTALPCGVQLGGAVSCARDAYAAYAYPAAIAGIDNDFPGHWILLPVCERCATETAALYGGDDDE